MTRMSLFGFSVVLALGLSAQGALHFEPHFGYAKGTVKQTSSFDAAGLGYGAKLGYSSMGFGVGLDYSITKLEIDTSPKSKSTATDMGVYVAYKLPVMFRLQGTYFFSSKLDDDDSSSFDTGKGYKLGGSLTTFPLVALNLDFYTIEYTKREAGGSSVTLSPAAKSSGIFLSLSLPLDF